MSEPENPCQAFFETHQTNSKKVEALLKETARFNWERLSASPHSPGPVGNGEEVVRVVISPIHIDEESGDIKPAFVSDVKDKGGSSDRLAHCQVTESIARATVIQAGKNAVAPVGREKRLVQGVARLTADHVRSLTSSSGVQAFGIYDTGLVGNPSHADICQLVADEKEARSARWDLLLLTRKGFERI